MNTENKDNELEYYMKMIDIEEVEDELNREFDMDSIIVKRVMEAIRKCIIDADEILESIKVNKKDIKRIKEIKERFLQIEYETEAKYGFGCGYWRVCDDHSCPCALTNKGFDEDIYEKMRKRCFED